VWSDWRPYNNIFTEYTSTSIQLLVILRYDNEHGFSTRALLIRHSNVITWDENTLEKLYSMYLALFSSEWIEKTWLLNNETVLRTASKKLVFGGFEIIISEWTRKDDTMESLWVLSNM
jgi:hypothetical protein